MALDFKVNEKSTQEFIERKSEGYSLQKALRRGCFQLHLSEGKVFGHLYI